METFNNGKPIRRIIERKADGTIIGWAMSICTMGLIRI
jgi:hypothetical protein